MRILTIISMLALTSCANLSEGVERQGAYVDASQNIVMSPPVAGPLDISYAEAIALSFLEFSIESEVDVSSCYLFTVRVVGESIRVVYHPKVHTYVSGDGFVVSEDAPDSCVESYSYEISNGRLLK